jgi:hypothetical protein
MADVAGWLAASAAWPAPQRCLADLHLQACKENGMSLGTILLIILILMLIGVVPSWPHSRSWGYGPSGGIGFVLFILLILILLGKV